ncbi:hypothetical protein AAMO2058_001372700 [Amorphochlora amoebiformis]
MHGDPRESLLYIYVRYPDIPRYQWIAPTIPLESDLVLAVHLGLNDTEIPLRRESESKDQYRFMCSLLFFSFGGREMKGWHREQARPFRVKRRGLALTTVGSTYKYHHLETSRLERMRHERRASGREDGGRSYLRDALQFSARKWS